MKVGIELEPDNEILRLFLSGAYLSNYPKLIDSVTNSTRWGQEFQNIMFFHEMDWEDKAGLEKIGGIKEGEVDIYLYDGRPNDTVISEKVFDKILYDYSVKLLEVYRNSKEVPKRWSEEMELAIKKLNQKIESKS